MPTDPIFERATLSCSSLRDAIPRVLDLVVREGRQVLVRGEPNLEVLGVDIAILDPTDRLPLASGRRNITAFCLVEFLWYCAQRCDLEPLEVYAPKIANFYGGMRSVTGSNYGRQLFHRAAENSQWDNVVSLLAHDSGSKRAFINMFSEEVASHLLPSNLDISCTTGFQILVRDGRLNWVTSMRANDAYRGFVSDTFSFTMLQELLASTVGLPVGEYLHRPTSLHTFPEDEAAITRVLARRNEVVATSDNSRMPPIQHNTFWQHLEEFWMAHDRSRKESNWSLLTRVGDMDDRWWQWVAEVLMEHHQVGSRD